MINNITIVGVGLIGGSFALALQDNKIAKHIIGVDANTANLQKALELGIINEALPLVEAVAKSDVIFIAIPVDDTIKVIQKIMPLLRHKQVVVDAGSTKQALCQALQHEPMRARFVATHPMWGTEYSGPEAALHYAFKGKACVICNAADSASDALEIITNIYLQVGMHLVYMNAQAHDLHIAYISHISHITSFALANTVLQKEKEEQAIFELASAGFESTVRLAKSNAAMWVPILQQNKVNVLDVLNELINQLLQFKHSLENDSTPHLKALIDGANKIGTIIK